MNILKKHKLVLASKSPRRSQLLKEAGIPFVIKTFDTPEDYPKKLKPKKVAEYLATKKAKAVAKYTDKDEIVLGADSIVLMKNKIFEKPKHRKDAIKILKQLSGKKHKVITGVCLAGADKEKSFSAISDVWMEPMTIAEIEYYVDTFQPYDKAGAYGIQEWIGHCKISKIKGTYNNIMGLPVERVYKALQKW